MKKRWLWILFSVFALFFAACEKKPEVYSDYSFEYFDTVTEVYGYAESEQEFQKIWGQIEGKLQEYHKLYDIYETYEGVTNLCDINQGTEEPVKVDEKIFHMLQRGVQMYEQTGGKVNIAMGSVLSIWHDHRTEGLEDPENAKLPDMEELKAAAEHTDIKNLMLEEENSTVFLADPAMKLDVGAIAKGYAVEEIARWMLQEGYEGYVLNVGGNVRLVGERPDGKAWTVGIENPDTENSEEPTIAKLAIRNMSLVTSGSYQRYYEVDGVKYHHIIDPDTLMPGENFRSVSVLCEDSGRADALSTALFSMSLEEGQALVEELDGVEAMWVTPEGAQVYSEGFLKYCVE